MKFAVIQSGGKQYKVQEGDLVELEKLDLKPKKTLDLKEVLLVVDKDKVSLGNPTIKGAKVSATVIDQIKGKKIRIAKFKAKSRYRKVQGHRQQLTIVKINKIPAPTQKKT